MNTAGFHFAWEDGAEEWALGVCAAFAGARKGKARATLRAMLDPREQAADLAAFYRMGLDEAEDGGAHGAACRDCGGVAAAPLR